MSIEIILIAVVAIVMGIVTFTIKDRALKIPAMAIFFGYCAISALTYVAWLLR